MKEKEVRNERKYKAGLYCTLVWKKKMRFFFSYRITFSFCNCSKTSRVWNRKWGFKRYTFSSSFFQQTKTKWKVKPPQETLLFVLLLFSPTILISRSSVNGQSYSKAYLSFPVRCAEWCDPLNHLTCSSCHWRAGCLSSQLCTDRSPYEHRSPQIVFVTYLLFSYQSLMVETTHHAFLKPYWGTLESKEQIRR